MTAEETPSTSPAGVTAAPNLRPGHCRLSLTAMITLVVLAACVLKGVWAPISRDQGSTNLYAYQARAFLHRHTNVTVALHDTATYKGRLFVPFPPFPAVVMMPIVALFGVQRANGPLLAVLLTLLNIVVANRMMTRLGLILTDRLWVLCGFFLGTGYWYIVISSGYVWFWAQTVAVTCLLLAVAEAWGRGRGHWVGLALTGALLSRQLTALAAMALAWRLWEHPAFTARAERRRNLAAFAATFSLGIATYLVFNYVRFGDAFDTGYGYITLTGFFQERFTRHGLFSVSYVPFNLIYLLLQGVHVEFNSSTKLSDITPDYAGTSLLGASPFVLLALLNAREGKTDRAVWASVISIAVFHLFYINNGANRSPMRRFSAIDAQKPSRDGVTWSLTTSRELLLQSSRFAVVAPLYKPSISTRETATSYWPIVSNVRAGGHLNQSPLTAKKNASAI